MDDRRFNERIIDLRHFLSEAAEANIYEEDEKCKEMLEEAQLEITELLDEHDRRH